MGEEPRTEAVGSSAGQGVDRTSAPCGSPSIQLVATLVPKWPKLAWLADIAEGSHTLRLLHGPCVEVHDDWFAEAVWCGDFAAGDFDRTDLIFGSGARLRGQDVVFVTSGTTLDRLWYRQSEGRLRVSNSLPVLCAHADVSLLEDRPFDRDTATVWGAPDCSRTFPVDSGEISVAWFGNLVYSGGRLREQIKPDTAPPFRRYEDYVQYLVDSARGLGENLRASGRRFGVTPFATVSSGYDSPAVAWIAKHAGCRQAVTIRNSTSLWRGSDSGAAIAERLGMSCRTYRRTARDYPHEAAVWAACGRPSLLSWSLFDYPEPVSAMFLGYHGDTMWSYVRTPHPYTMFDLGMGELRLCVGTLLCVIPYWGMRHLAEVDVITLSDEMAPWRLGTSYDRPIARRILEEAGVPRGAFGVRKKDTSHESPFRWPYSPEARSSFADYLRGRGLLAPPDWLLSLIRCAAHTEKLLHHNIFGKLGLHKRLRLWQRLAGVSLLPHWANEELKGRYREALRDVDPGAAARQEGKP